jgi:hypothetical protein
MKSRLRRMPASAIRMENRVNSRRVLERAAAPVLGKARVSVKARVAAGLMEAAGDRPAATVIRGGGAALRLAQPIGLL